MVSIADLLPALKLMAVRQPDDLARGQGSRAADTGQPAHRLMHAIDGVVFGDGVADEEGGAFSGDGDTPRTTGSVQVFKGNSFEDSIEIRHLFSLSWGEEQTGKGKGSEHAASLAGPAIMRGQVRAEASEVETPRPSTTTQGDQFLLSRNPAIQLREGVDHRISVTVVAAALTGVGHAAPSLTDGAVKGRTGPVGTGGRDRVVLAVVVEGP